MARTGQNPMKWLETATKPHAVTVTSIVHIPELKDFWAESLDVLKLCFQSLHENTKEPFDLLVVDNGSCSEVREYLLDTQSTGGIQFLFFSNYNLRKIGALRMLLGAAPGEIISYADSDVYFLPGWLGATLKVLATFPEAAQVTALPTSDRIGQFTNSTLRGITQDHSLHIKRGYDLVPERFKEAHRLSIGKTKEQYAETLTGKEEVLITRNGVSAYASAQDFQFTTTRKALDAIGPLVLRSSGEYFDPVYSPAFEARADERGFWRLSTSDYLVHHIGNRMPSKGDGDDWIFRGAPPRASAPTSAARGTGFTSRLLRSPRVRGVLKRVNAVSYSLLFER